MKRAEDFEQCACRENGQPAVGQRRGGIGLLSERVDRRARSLRERAETVEIFEPFLGEQAGQQDRHHRAKEHRRRQPTQASAIAPLHVLMHQIGHAWELHHCLDPRCSMYLPWTPSFAAGEPIFCTFCRDKSEQKLRLAKS